MEKLKSLIREMSLEYFASGIHRCDIEEFKRILLEKKKAYMLDVRSKEEYDILHFNFMTNIPLNELPDKYEELPKDKLIILFCSCRVRVLIAYILLRVLGFEQVKILDADIEILSGIFKPLFVTKFLNK